MRCAFNLLVFPTSMFTQFFISKGYVLSGEIALKDDHYYYYYHNCIQSLHSDAFRYQFFARGVRHLNVIPYHLATKPSLESFHTAAFQLISSLQWHKHPGTNTWCLVQNSAFLLLLLFCFCYCYLLFVLLQLFFFFFAVLA